MIYFILLIALIIFVIFFKVKSAKRIALEDKEKLDKYFKKTWDPIIRDLSVMKTSTNSKIDVLISNAYTDSTKSTRSDRYYEIRFYLFDAPFIPYTHLDWDTLVRSQLYKDQPAATYIFGEKHLWHIDSNLSATFTSSQNIYNPWYDCKVGLSFSSLKKEFEARYASQYDNLQFSSTQAYVLIQ